MGQWDFFQLEPHTIGDDWVAGSRKGLRPTDMKLSNFGSLFYGARMSTDYTRTTLEFSEKSLMEGADAQGVHSLRGMPRGFDAEFNPNPHILNSSVKMVRDDQFVRMGMSMGGADILGLNTAPNSQIDQPMMDEMDTKVSRGPWTAGINYPTEGWRSFGGKYDYHRAYDGTLR